MHLTVEEGNCNGRDEMTYPPCGMQLSAGEGIGKGLAAEAAAAAAFGVARGVGDVAPSLWLNGALSTRVPGARWQQLLGFAVQMEQQRLQARNLTPFSPFPGGFLFLMKDV